MADIPDGVDYDTAKAAIAWAMTRWALESDSAFHNASYEQKLQLMTEMYAKAIQAVIKREALKSPPG